MYGAVQVPRKSLDSQVSHAGEKAVEAVRSLAAPLQGARVLSLSLSPFGTGVAELLHSLVPLLRDLGLQTDWRVVHGGAEYGQIIRLLYDGLCGKGVSWTSEAAAAWRDYSRVGAASFDDSYDVVIVHEPQLVGVREILEGWGLTGRATRWVWQCHMDLRSAQPEVWQTILPALQGYDAWIAQDSAFVPGVPPSVLFAVIPPAIDPTNAANMELSRSNVRQFCKNQGINPLRPLIVQVGPLDDAFDPIGAIDIYRRAKAERPDLQLLLAHPGAESSLEAWSLFEQVARHADGDPHVRVLATQSDTGRLTINAAQRAATVVMQRAVPAGFAPRVYEAQWKGRPVVVGRAGSMASQVVDGQTGRVATDDDSFAQALLSLISDPAAARALGAAGREAVRRDHLITRLLADELALLRELLVEAPIESRPPLDGTPISM